MFHGRLWVKHWMTPTWPSFRPLRPSLSQNLSMLWEYIVINDVYLAQEASQQISHVPAEFVQNEIPLCCLPLKVPPTSALDIRLLPIFEPFSRLWVRIALKWIWNALQFTLAAGLRPIPQGPLHLTLYKSLGRSGLFWHISNITVSISINWRENLNPLVSIRPCSTNVFHSLQVLHKLKSLVECFLCSKKGILQYKATLRIWQSSHQSGCGRAYIGAVDGNIIANGVVRDEFPQLLFFDSLLYHQIAE